MYNKFLSYIIKDIRDIFEMTQKEFGEAIEKSEISIRKYESGEYNIPFTVLFIILKLFDIDIVLLKGIIDDVKEILINEKNIMNNDQFQECLERFKNDISRIYKINIDKDQLNNFESIDEIKAIFDNQLQEYIEQYAARTSHEIVRSIVISAINKDLTTQIRKEIINFIDYNIEKLLGYMFISEEEFRFLEKKQTEEFKKIAEIHKKLNSNKK